MEDKVLLQAIKEIIQAEIKPLKEEVSAIKGQLDENTLIIKGIMHNSETLNAKIDGLTVTTASKDSIGEVMKRLDQIDQKQTTQGESINLLALNQFQHETEIALLKKAE